MHVKNVENTSSSLHDSQPILPGVPTPKQPIIPGVPTPEGTDPQDLLAEEEKIHEEIFAERFLTGTVTYDEGSLYKQLGLLLPFSRHAQTGGTLNFGFPDGTKISGKYREFNPKMDDSPDKSYWWDHGGLESTATSLMDGSADLDMIFLDSEVSPDKLNQLLHYPVIGPDGQPHCLADKFAVANDPFRGAILVDKSKFVVSYTGKECKVGKDEVPGQAGCQDEYVSLFSIHPKGDPSHTFQVCVGKGPHYANGHDAKFLPNLLKFMQDNTPKGMPAAMIGDWNNEITKDLIDKYAPQYKDMFQNLYSPLVDTNGPHQGSNMKEALAEARAWQEAHPGEPVDISKFIRDGKVNTQVLSFTNGGCSVSVDDPKILIKESFGRVSGQQGAFGGQDTPETFKLPGESFLYLNQQFVNPEDSAIKEKDKRRKVKEKSLEKKKSDDRELEKQRFHSMGCTTSVGKM